MTAMLVDARNALYRAVYANKSDKSSRSKQHCFVIFLRFLARWSNELKPSSINIFWDAPRDTVWRRTVHPKYKDRSSSGYVDGISEDLENTTIVAKALLSKMGMRQFERKAMEADDLIYTAVSVLHPFETKIVSTDSDMLQIPFKFNSCSVFNPKQMEIVTCKHNPVLMKSLVGDKADSIEGYCGIGPKKGANLVENTDELYKYLELNGRNIFNRNLLLIDLSMCPKLLANTIYVHKQLAKPVEFSKEDVYNLSIKHKVHGLEHEFYNLVSHFKNLI